MRCKVRPSQPARAILPHATTRCLLLYDTGLRVGEFVALDVSMLDLDEGIVMLPGTILGDKESHRTEFKSFRQDFE